MYYYAMEYSELVDSFKKVVTVEGHKILLALLAGKIYAIKDQCTHLGSSLSKGQIELQSVTCKSHGAIFDLQSGEVLEKAHIGFVKMPTKKTIAFKTKVENGKILIEI